MVPKQVTIVVFDSDAAAAGSLAARLEHIPGFAVARLAASPAELAKGRAPDIVFLGPSRLSSDFGEAIARLHRRVADIAILKLLAPGAEAEVPRLARIGVLGFLAPEADASECALAMRTVTSGGGYLSPALFETLFTGLASQAFDPAVYALTTREQEVLGLVGQSMSNKDIARRLGLSVRTVETHRLNIRKKTGVGSRREFAEIATRLGVMQRYRPSEEGGQPGGFHEFADDAGMPDE